jgi:hypothetical protein
MATSLKDAVKFAQTASSPLSLTVFRANGVTDDECLATELGVEHKRQVESRSILKVYDIFIDSQRSHLFVCDCMMTMLGAGRERERRKLL